jgi:hypothetical protein
MHIYTFIYYLLKPNDAVRSPVCSHLLTLVLHSWIFLPWRWRRYFPPKHRFTQDLHGATSQKTAFFIVTAVNTSNLTQNKIKFALYGILIFISTSRKCWISCLGPTNRALIKKNILAQERSSLPKKNDGENYIMSSIASCSLCYQILLWWSNIGEWAGRNGENNMGEMGNSYKTLVAEFQWKPHVVEQRRREERGPRKWTGFVCLCKQSCGDICEHDNGYLGAIKVLKCLD